MRELIDAAAAGDGGTLMVVGEPGAGKTALLSAVVRAVELPLRLERATAVEDEMAYPYAGLQQLCGRMTGELETLPEPQRAALEAAFGVREAGRADPFLIGLAVLGALSAAARCQPVVCTVDDAQWLDEASISALAFVARRLAGQPIALIFATSEASDGLADLPRIALEPLRDSDARVVLQETIADPIDPVVRDQIIAEARGNPLALREIPWSFLPGVGLRHPEPISPAARRIERQLIEELDALSIDARRLLLLAAMEPTGDPTKLARASTTLGIGPETFSQPEIGEALAIGARVRFRRRLARGALIRSANPAERRRVHAALADAVDGTGERDRRAWHLACAVLDPDEAVAAELVAAAPLAAERSGTAATATYLERAAAISPQPLDQSLRLLDAAEARFQAGPADAALRLLDAIPAVDLPPLAAARAARLRIQVRTALGRSADAATDLLAIAIELAPLDGDVARSTAHEALFEAVLTGRLATAPSATPAGVAATILERLQLPDDHGPTALLLRGQARFVAGAPDHAAADLSAALQSLSTVPPGLDTTRWAMLCGRGAVDAWDIDAMRLLVDRQLGRARAAGDLGTLPGALNFAVLVYLLDGRLEEARACIAEIDAIRRAMPLSVPLFSDLIFAAWRGDEADLRRRSAPLRDMAHGLQAGAILGTIAFSETLLHMGCGRYADAAAVARAELDHAQEGSLTTRTAVELVEAAVRTGDPELASRAFETLEQAVAPFTTDWALGVRSLARGQLHDDGTSETHFAVAVDHFSRARLGFQEGRARLSYGEWLRRRRRRVDAREQLRLAQTLLGAVGALAFAARAGRELDATGEVARRRTPDEPDALTVQEGNVARLAAEGLSNREIATRLFIGVRTVEYHLRKVFIKLGIRSRHELPAALDDTT